MSEKKTELLLTLIMLLAPLLTVLIGWGRIKAAQLLGVQIKNEKFEGVMLRVNDRLWTLMLNAEQTLVASIKRAKDPLSEGGTDITESEGKQIKVDVLDQFKKLEGADGLKEIMSVLGIETPELLMDFLSSKLESAVATKKLMEKGSPSSIEKVGEMLKVNFK